RTGRHPMNQDAKERSRVLVTEAIHPIGIEVLGREVEVVNLPERAGETVAQHLPSVDGVLVRTARLTAPLLETALHPKIIGKHGVGVDNIDVAAARRFG